jgi:hypothetical protein
MPKIPTKTQVSSGGVAFRQMDGRTEVVLISVGVETSLLGPIDQIEYWYVSKQAGVPTRFHKFVSFFLLAYLSGDPENHDFEVNDARWMEIGEAEAMLTFESEQKVLAKAKGLIMNR